MNLLGIWIRTRRGGSFIIAFFIFIAIGSVMTVAALIYANSNGSNRLAVAGTFASGVAALFGLAAVATALLANYVVVNRDSVDAEQAWSKKLRLEEALTYYFVLLQDAVNVELRDPEGDIGRVGLNPLVRHARLILQEALAESRKTGLPRVLSLLDEEKEASGNDARIDLGDALMLIEAHNAYDLNTNKPEFGQSITIVVAETNLMERLSGISYDEMARYWNVNWKRINDATAIARMLTPRA